MARRFRNGFCLLPATGENGQGTRGRIRVIGALYAMLCEGVDPWVTPRQFSRTHEQIERGGAYVKLAWVMRSDQRSAIYTRHCEACAAIVEEVYRGQETEAAEC